MPELRQLINLFLVIGALFALWKGGRAERLAAGVVICNVVIGTVGSYLAPEADELVRLVNDGVAALALLAITIRYAALWMGGVMLFFAAQFSLHSWYLVTDRPHDYLHALVNNLNWTGVTWCLIIGAAMAWRQRLRKHRARAADEPAP